MTIFSLLALPTTVIPLAPLTSMDNPSLTARSARRHTRSALTFLVFCSTLPGYVDGTVQKLDIGATSIVTTNSGSLGGTQTVTFPSPGSGRIKAWFSEAGYPERVGSENACANPCGVSLNTERGRVSYWYEITDSSGNPLSPRKLSSELHLTFTQAPCATAPFTVPIGVHGTGPDYTTCLAFSIAGGADVSNTRIAIRAFNLRQGTAAVFVNSQSEKIIRTYDVIGAVCTKTVSCTVTTDRWHGIGVGQKVQLNGFAVPSGESTDTLPINDLNGNYTVSSITLTTITVPTSWTISGALCADPCTLQTFGKYMGKTVGAIQYGDERKYFGGMDSTHTESYWVMVPLGASELTAGATNTLSLRFKGPGDTSIHDLVHGWYAREIAILQGNDCEITQMIVTSGNAVGTCNGHGWSNGDTILIRDAPGPYWRFNGLRVLTAVTTNTFTFPWGPASGAGSAPYTTANGTYVVPTTANTTVAQQPHMYATRSLIPKTDFTVRANPNGSESFPSLGGNASNGQTIYQTTVLKEPNGYFANHASIGVCADCHSKTAQDLKYFSYDPYVILVAAIKRGLSESDSKDVVAYVAANSASYTGEPWTPVMQPCPGVDSQVIAKWSGWCGDEWQLTYDNDSKEYFIPSGSYANWAPNQTFNLREMPIFLAMPPWLHWLPRTNPKDFFNLWGFNFTGAGTVPAPSCGGNATNDGSLWANYQNILSTQTTNDYTTFLANNHYRSLYDAFCNWTTTPGKVPFPAFPEASYQWPVQNAKFGYDLTLWVVKTTWELHNRFQTQNFYNQSITSQYGSTDPRAAAQWTRGWYNLYPFRAGPHVSIGGQDWFGNTYVKNNRNWNKDTAMWYHLQAITGPGNRMFTGNDGIDMPYQFGFNNELSKLRPAFYMGSAPIAFGLQNTWGWPTLTNMGVNTLHMRLVMAPRWNDLLTPSADVAAVMNQAAQQLIAAIGTFSVGAWQTAITSDPNKFGSCALSATPAPQGAWSGSSSCLADGIAMAAPMWRYYGLSTPDLATIRTWFNAVFTASGHDLQTDINATCDPTYLPGGQQPARLHCNN